MLQNPGPSGLNLARHGSYPDDQFLYLHEEDNPNWKGQHQTKLNQLLEIFPDCCPKYLREACRDFETNEEFEEFLNNVLDLGSYPKIGKSNGNIVPEIVYSSNDEEEDQPEQSTHSIHGLKELQMNQTRRYENDRSLTSKPDAILVEYSPDNKKAPPENVEDVWIIDSQDCPEVDGNENEKWVSERTSELVSLFPNVDPRYLREKCVQFEGSLDAMNEFVLEKLEKNDMPSREKYEKELEMEELRDRYTKNFSIEDFLKVIPDPWTYFKRMDRNCGKYKLHSLDFLKSSFKYQLSSKISSVLIENNDNLYVSYKSLRKMKNGINVPRRPCRCDSRPTDINIQFLQEVAFIKNEKNIKRFLEEKKIAKKLKFEEAKKGGLLVECQCCFDPEVMVEDAVYCPNDHSVCKTCIIRFVEVEMGQAKYEYQCLHGCGEKYSLASLQAVIKPELFSNIIQMNQMEEIKAAGIEDLVHCPFCNYATILPPQEKIMVCLNPECQKESCRLCKELSHIPLKCNEVEKSEDVKMRTYIENKMTDALIRTCYKCQKKFIKEEGCNKMKCSCGAIMCYVCRKPITDYSHFNGQGGTDYSKCPLYSTNDELHVEIVKRVAEEAKAEVLTKNSKKSLVHDPTMVLPEKTYKGKVPGVQAGNALEIAMRAIRTTTPVQEPEAPVRGPTVAQPANRHHRHNHHHHHCHRANGVGVARQR